MDTLPPHAENGNYPQKRCLGPCRRLLPATNEFFNKNKACKDGLHTQCKQCRSKKNKDHYNQAEVHDRRLAQAKAYRDIPEIKEQRRALNKEWRERPGAKTNRQNYTRNYRKRPGVMDKKRAQAKEYSSRPETREQRRPKERVYSSHRRAMKKAIGGTYTAQQIQEQLKRQKYRCYYAACGFAEFEKKNGKYIYHIDHTFPLHRVIGTNIPANDISYLVLACPHCNASKNDKFPWEWPEGGRLL